MATPRGWYDVGDGFAGMWDGEKWTGERISHEQLRALSRPAAPPPPMAPPPPTSIGARPQWSRRKQLIVTACATVGAFAVVSMIALNSKPRQTRTEQVNEILQPVATDMRKHCDSVQLVGKRISVRVPDGSTDCAAATGAMLKAWGFTEVDLTRAMAGQEIERGKFTLTAANSVTAGLLVQVDVD